MQSAVIKSFLSMKAEESDLWRDERSIQGLVALRWSNVDEEAGIVTVRHVKGKKEHVAEIRDSTNVAKRALACLQKSWFGQYPYVFEPSTRGRRNNWLADAPTSDELAALFVERAAAAAALGQLAPDGLRRTFITAGLDLAGKCAICRGGRHMPMRTLGCTMSKPPMCRRGTRKSGYRPPGQGVAIWFSSQHLPGTAVKS